MDNDKLIRMYENDIKEYEEELQEHLEKIEYIKSKIAKKRQYLQFIKELKED